MNTSLEYLLGPTIREFSGDSPPKIKEVLSFYSQFWGTQGSESFKEKAVAQELITFYEQRGIPTLSELTIKGKIRKIISEMRKILKFKSKQKTTANVETERVFCLKLNDVFNITRTEIICEARTESTPSTSSNCSGEYFCFCD